MRAVWSRNYGTVQADPGTTGLLSRLFLEDARFNARSRPASLGRSILTFSFSLHAARQL
jgi:hypothetical protein